MTLTTTPDRLAVHGNRRCGFGTYDVEVASTPDHSNALAMIIDHLLGPNHPGYTADELFALKEHDRGRPAHDEAALASGLALREMQQDYARRRFGVAA